MKTFLSIFKKFGKDIIYLTLILGVFLHGRYGGSESPPPVAEPPILVVDEGQLAKEVIADAERADEPRGIVERFDSHEIQPDTVYVSAPVPDVGEPVSGDSLDNSPRRLRSEALVLPEWGIQEVVLGGHRLEVSSLSRATGGVERSIHTLSGNYQPGLTIRSGNVASAVREDREFRFLRLQLALESHAGLNPSTGAPIGTAILSGPVSVGGDDLRISPSVAVSAPGGLSVGVSARLCLIGGC